ncbi:Secreted glycosyl hydrolase [Planctomycetales bacterium 10988]|nr:Secreted glycosyl hydrolase [Planctomycetales bacterium 10988]
MYQKITCWILFVVTFSFGTSCYAQENIPAESNEHWQTLFDGSTMEGWEKVGKEDSFWELQDGILVGSGTQSMLVCTEGPFTNFKLRAEVKINSNGNSGMYFRTTREPSFLDGYEAQINSNHKDPIRTGSLYGFCSVYTQHVKPDTWFTYEVEVKDDVWRKRELTRIKLTVNDQELYEFLDFDKTFLSGHIAFQQHDPGSTIKIRKVEILNLDD